MKNLAVLCTGAVLTFCVYVFAHSTVRPALGLTCVATDADLKFEMIINEFTGDMFPGTFILSEGGKQITSEIKQYSNYKGRVTMVVSKGPDANNDDVGYIIDLNKSYKGGYYGDATQYIANPPGTRDEQDNTWMRLDCTSTSP